ncbi:MAG: sigma-54 dependent transcriptional regulator [Longimicrobiales bacterium]|nr:sigma-54 dependent transcriptional regulator [Longimicrobiales bacterium]
MKRSILVVDDDARILASLSRALAREVDEIRTADNADEALQALAESPAAIALVDLKMPGMDGLELLAILRERTPDLDVIMMTAYEDLPTVAAAMRGGAVDFLTKPLDLHSLRRLLARVFEDQETRTAALSRRAPGGKEETRLVGRDPAMVEIFKVVGQVAGTRTNVVIRGESGTGKELVAREIHLCSPYAEEPFVAVNCMALPETLLESELFGHVRGSFTGATGNRKGRFALAGRGTIFLDEIGDTAPEFQAKLLRVLQEHEYYPVGAERSERSEARVVTATHQNLEKLVAAGRFREDLYYRLRVVEIHIPPLRDRLGDVSVLAEHLVSKAATAVGKRRVTLAPETMRALLAYSWPGNVRELENCLTRAVVTATGDVVRPEHLALEAPSVPAKPRLTTLEDVEREHVAHVLRATKGHKTRTAEILGISRPRLDRLIKKHDLDDVVG